MNALRAVKALGPIDAKSVRRDSLLRWLILFPALIAAVVRYGVPFLTGAVLEEFQFDVTPYYDLMLSFIILTMPLVVGSVIGFLLLDQRDDHTLMALQVTPLTLNGYLAYRIALPMFLSVVTTLLAVPVMNLVQLNLLVLVLTALLAAPLAPLSALFLAAFAQNKVQGFALSKGSSVFLVPALIAYFIPSGWQFVFGITPTYWPVKLFWAGQAGEPNLWIYIVVGLVYQFVLLMLLVRRFNRVMHE